jgi:hypothetical protein
MIQVTKLKKAFNEEGLQITTQAINILDSEVKLLVKKWVKNTKFGNIKRLTADTIWVALGRYLNKGGKK